MFGTRQEKDLSQTKFIPLILVEKFACLILKIKVGNKKAIENFSALRSVKIENDKNLGRNHTFLLLTKNKTNNQLFSETILKLRRKFQQH